LSKDKQQTIPFSTVLASTVHDMKNALGVILISLGDITDKLNEADPNNTKINVLRYETSRVNGLLVQLLALYKAEQKQLPININYYNVYDFLEDQVLAFDELLSSKKITVSLNIEEELEYIIGAESNVYCSVGLLNLPRLPRSCWNTVTSFPPVWVFPSLSGISIRF